MMISEDLWCRWIRLNRLLRDSHWCLPRKRRGVQKKLVVMIEDCCELYIIGIMIILLQATSVDSFLVQIQIQRNQFLIYAGLIQCTVMILQWLTSFRVFFSSRLDYCLIAFFSFLFLFLFLFLRFDTMYNFYFLITIRTSLVPNQKLVPSNECPSSSSSFPSSSFPSSSSSFYFLHLPKPPNLINTTQSSDKQTSSFLPDLYDFDIHDRTERFLIVSSVVVVVAALDHHLRRH